MAFTLDKKHLAKYPFLKEAQGFVQTMDIPLDTLIRSELPTGARIREQGAQRLIAAMIPEKRPDNDTIAAPDEEIKSYAMARIIASCLNDRSIMDRLARYEAGRAGRFLEEEDDAVRRYVAESLGLEPETEHIPVPRYVELVSGLRDDRWRLVNRTVSRGRVDIGRQDLDVLVVERIRTVIRSQLPLQVPGGICMKLRESMDRISATYQQQMLEEFGEIDEGSFPPCMQALIAAITAGTNLPHTGRFALTAFLHTIGMETTQIVEVFTRAPDFDVGRTLYQVEHIAGRGGTEYTPPGCATMRTYGLCVNRNADCERVAHPLSYYKRRKKQEKPKPGSQAD
ncbi:MAG: DNA primase large subunit PriL [Methanomicrobiales archaeon]|nr:DNA primase large subunit PriL [Methanomicrobiales archaeon]